jgi:hypothetical protein
VTSNLIRVESYDRTLTLTGWLKGKATLSIPKRGAVELTRSSDGELCLRALGPNGETKPVRVEDE